MRKLLLLVLFVSATGCETNVSPVVGTSEPYTIYGYIGAEIDTQAVNVIPIRNQLPLFSPDTPIDAAVTSTDLVSGEERVWNDSLVFFDDGSWSHVFWSDFVATPLHAYKIDVRRSDGAESSATTTVPAAPVATIGDPVVLGASLVTQEVRWQPVVRLVDVFVDYDVSPAVPGQPDQIVSVPYQARPDGDDWVIEVNLSDDFRFASTAFTQTGIILNGVSMRIFSVDEAWSQPGGTFDFDVLAEPGALDNVENGHGFVGAGVREVVSWQLDDQTLTTIGYQVQ